MSTNQKFTTNDLRLIAGIIREVDNDLFVPVDVVHVLLLFWAFGELNEAKWPKLILFYCLCSLVDQPLQKQKEKRRKWSIDRFYLLLVG